MGQLSDRERLIRLIHERRERARAISGPPDVEESQAAPDDEAKRSRREQLKTQAILERCQATFHDFPLEETGHILRVSVGPGARNLGPNGIEATGGVDFVLITVDHRDAQGACTVPLLAARYRLGKYVLVDYERCYLAKSAEELHDKMLQLVSEMDEGYVYIVLEKFRRLAAAPESHSSSAAQAPAGGVVPGPRQLRPTWQPGCGNIELRAVIGGFEPPGRTPPPRFFQ